MTSCPQKRETAHGSQTSVPICRFLSENVARNDLRSRFFWPKNAPFSCGNANLPNRTCFTRLPPNGDTIPWEQGVEHLSKKKSAQNTALLPHAPWQARGDPNKCCSQNHSLIPRGFSIQASLGGGGSGSLHATTKNNSLIIICV